VLVVEQLLDLAGNLGVHVPSAAGLIPIAIRNWEQTAPFLRALAAERKTSPRAALRQIFKDWRNPP
jgi:hypothetical protein